MKRALVLLAACGGATRAPDNHGGATPARAIGAGMFERGHTWRYQHDSQDEVGQRRRNIVTCTVDSVEPIVGGTRSVVSCDDRLAGVVDGVWATDGHGLYYLGEPPARGALDAQHLVLALPPVASPHVHPQGDAWCIDIGDAEASATTCYDADGVVSERATRANPDSWSSGKTDLVRMP